MEFISHLLEKRRYNLRLFLMSNVFISGVGGVAMGGGGAASGAWMGGAPGGRPGPLGHNSVMNGTNIKLYPFI